VPLQHKLFLRVSEATVSFGAGHLGSAFTTLSPTGEGVSFKRQAQILVDLRERSQFSHHSYLLLSNQQKQTAIVNGSQGLTCNIVAEAVISKPISTAYEPAAMRMSDYLQCLPFSGV
jgi:hypothetical protein